MDKRLVIITTRVALGAITLFAVVLQALVVNAQGAFDLVNYLSYFTNLSNIVAALILIVSAVYLIKSRVPSPRDDMIRGAATLYMAVTGVVYVTLLTGVDLGLLLPWVNILLHIVMPLAVITDWMLRPPRSKLGLRHIGIWLVFPAVFLIYSLIRGALVGWYPYPFLNPDKIGGYDVVALYCGGILVAFFALSWLVITLGNLSKRDNS